MRLLEELFNNNKKKEGKKRRRNIWKCFLKQICHVLCTGGRPFFFPFYFSTFFKCWLSLAHIEIHNNALGTGGEEERWETSRYIPRRSSCVRHYARTAPKTSRESLPPRCLPAWRLLLARRLDKSFNKMAVTFCRTKRRTLKCNSTLTAVKKKAKLICEHRNEMERLGGKKGSRDYFVRAFWSVNRQHWQETLCKVRGAPPAEISRAGV